MIKIFAQTDVGRVRRSNEDSFLVVDTLSEAGDALPAIREISLRDKWMVLMVSDGMGGAAAGEVASSMAVRVVREKMAFSGVPAAEELSRGLRDALHVANREIVDYAEAHPRTYGMGATATTAGIINRQLFIGQIGDSRAYLLRDHTIKQLTTDQSFVNQLVEAGKITEEEAETHPRRNVILQALGNQLSLDVVLTREELRDGDYLLLCTDGLSGSVRKDEMLEIVQAAADVQAACQGLIDLANQRGGPDNITVVLAQFAFGERDEHVSGDARGD